MKRLSTRSALRAARPSPYLRVGRNVVLKRSRRRRFVRRSSLGGAALLLTLACLAWLGAAGIDWLENTPLLAVQAVSMRGTRFADQEQLHARLAQLRGANLLAVELPALRAALLEDAWVKEAVIRRVFPHTISVEIHERQPVAVALLDGMPTVVDASGAVIVAWSVRLGALDLPLITGVTDATGRERDRQIRAGITALAALQRHDPGLIEQLSELDISRPDRITAHLIGEPAPLLLHPEDVTANLDHYLFIRDDIRRRVPDVAAIDLRWRGRVVIVPRDVAARSARLHPGSGGRGARPGHRVTFLESTRRGGRHDG